MRIVTRQSMPLLAEDLLLRVYEKEQQRVNLILTTLDYICSGPSVYCIKAFACTVEKHLGRDLTQVEHHQFRARSDVTCGPTLYLRLIKPASSRRRP